MRVFSFICLVAAVSAWKVEEAPGEGWRRVIRNIYDADAEPEWMAPESVATLIDFVDITDHQDWVVSKRVNETRFYPTVPTQQQQVAAITALGSAAEMQRQLEALESFQNRYYTTFGEQSALSLRNVMAGYIAAANRPDATVELFQHANWAQPSVIGRIVGTNPNLGMLIVGAHEDSINHNSANKPQARAPGADDDGTGTVTVLEIFRIMLNSGFRPQRTVEFQLYAAEEVGLLGSADIAQTYARQNANVYGMFQLDMNGYCANRAQSLIMRQTSVDVTLSNFLSLMINTYSDMTNQDTGGSFNSDHGSWTRSGFPASHCKEAGGYPFIHSDNDLAFRLDYNCMIEFVKIGVGFVVELDNDI